MAVARFLDSWALFANSYALTLLAAATLAMLGVIAAARRQLFMTAAVAQASGLGYACYALAVGASATLADAAILRDSVVIGAAIVAALVTTLGSGQSTMGTDLDGDERTALLFALSAATAILVLANASSGMEQFRRLQTSSVLGATATDAILMGSLLVILTVMMLVSWRAIVILLTDPVMAAAIGLRVGLWNVAFAMLIGFAVGLAVRSTGVIFAFGCLALPVLIAKQVCGEVRTLFWMSPLIAVGTGLVGLWVAYAWNLPAGQVVVVLLCVEVVIVMSSRRLAVLGRSVVRFP